MTPPNVLNLEGLMDKGKVHTAGSLLGKGANVPDVQSITTLVKWLSSLMLTPTRTTFPAMATMQMQVFGTPNTT
jgi:hypothetical protein